MIDTKQMFEPSIQTLSKARRFKPIYVNRQGTTMWQQHKTDLGTRLFFIVSGSIIWLGIALTGFGSVHWLLFIPPTFFYFAAATGICPGLIVSKWLTANRAKSSQE